MLLQIPIPRPLFEEFESDSLPFYSKFRQLNPGLRLLFTNIMSMLHRLMEFISRSSETDQELVKEIAVYLSLLYYAIPDIAQLYFLSLDLKRYVEVLTSHADQHLRELYRLMLNRSFSIVAALSSVNLQKSDDVSPARTKLLQHLSSIISFLPELHKHPTKMKQYFEFWRAFCFTTPTFMQYCFDEGLLSKFIGFVLQKRSPLSHNLKQEISQEWIGTAMSPITSMVAALLMNSNLSEEESKGRVSHELTEDELKCLNFMPLYRQMIDADCDSSSLMSIVGCLATGNRKFTAEFARILLQGLNQFSSYKSSLAYMTVLLT